MNLDPTQLDAINRAVNSSFSVITGGAGTGKTTIIKEIHDRIRESKPVKLCAFAGKAAARLKEATKVEAATIHRMLGFMGTRFTLGSLKGSAVIVDEASMVDSELMAEIIEREPDQLILVGDAAQLPPVGKGQPFHDIIALRPDVVSTLTKCYRNSEAVFKAATAIRNGSQVLNSDDSENEKWRLLETGDDQQTHDMILDQVRRGFFDFEQDVILCPKNGSEDVPASVESLNQDIAKALFPDRMLHERFVVGDRVMVTKNNPDKDVWNGTAGQVIAVDVDGGLHLKLDEPVIDWDKSKVGEAVYKDQVKLSKAESKDVKLAYALTVHKSQGSQYRRVVFICLKRDARSLLSRPLIYTAVTRTKEHCIVVGSRNAFHQGCRNIPSKDTVLQQLAKGVA